MRLRWLICTGLLGLLAACGSAGPPGPAATATQPLFAPYSNTPPAAVGTGLVCGIAADRVLGIRDREDLRRLTGGAAAPRSPLILEAIAQYGSSRSSSAREHAAGLIVGQCAAYGFYVITYRECLRPVLVGNVAPTPAIKSCIDRRRWTLYTQQ